MSESNAWKVAREAAAAAYRGDGVWDTFGEFEQTLLALPEPPAFRAAVEAERREAKSWQTVALSNQAASQSHQERWAKAEAELASGSFYKEDDVDRLMADRDAAKAEAERLREAMTLVERIKYMEGKSDKWTAATMAGCINAALSDASLDPYQRLFPRARAAIAAMRGE